MAGTCLLWALRAQRTPIITAVDPNFRTEGNVTLFCARSSSLLRSSRLRRRAGLATLTLATTVGVVTAAMSPAVSAASPVSIGGFEVPESVVHDVQSDTYLVSNVGAGGDIAAGELAADDNGFISRVRPDGQVLDRRWIDGRSPSVRLDSPHGIDVLGNRIFVADLTVVRQFDRSTGRQLASVPLPGSVFLNDLTVGPDQAIYVTDSGYDAEVGNDVFQTNPRTDAVWRIPTTNGVPSTGTKIARGGGLGNPNGIVAGTRPGPYGDRVVVRVASYDISLPAGASGVVFTPGPHGERYDQVAFPTGLLDGLVQTGGFTIVSSGVGPGYVYAAKAGHPVRTLFTGSIVADLAVDTERGRLLEPLFYDNQLRIQPLAIG